MKNSYHEIVKASSRFACIPEVVENIPAHFCKSRQLFSCPTYIYMLNKPVKLFQTSFAIEIVMKIELPIYKNEK